MTIVHTAAVNTDPSRRPAEMTWIDEGLTRGKPQVYRVVAIDTVGNVSAPSATIAAAAIDTIPPEPPLWTDIAWILVTGVNQEEPYTAAGALDPQKRPAIRLRWSSNVPGGQFTVLRRAERELSWRRVDGDAISAGVAEFALRDDAASPKTAYVYRVMVKSDSGLTSIRKNDIDVGQPT
jgi:hypothetical protein